MENGTGQNEDAKFHVRRLLPPQRVDFSATLDRYLVLAKADLLEVLVWEQGSRILSSLGTRVNSGGRVGALKLLQLDGCGVVIALVVDQDQPRHLRMFQVLDRRQQDSIEKDPDGSKSADLLAEIKTIPLCGMQNLHSSWRKSGRLRFPNVTAISLAVDPLNRAFCVAIDTQFQLWTVRHNLPVNPILNTTDLSERIRSTVGDFHRIIHAEFMYPGPLDPQKICAVICLQQETNGIDSYSLISLELASASDNPADATIRGLLPFPEKFPRPFGSLSLPKFPGAFLLVTEDSCLVIRLSDLDLNGSGIHLRQFLFPYINISGISSIAPIPDSEYHSQDQQCLLLAKDGSAFNLSINLDSYVDMARLAHEIFEDGRNISFFGLDNFFFASHDQADNALFQIDFSSDSPDIRIIQTFPNRGTIKDFVVMRSDEEDFDSIYALCGQEKCASVNIIKRGISASTLCSSESSGFNHANAVFKVETLIFASMIYSTCVFRFANSVLEDITLETPFGDGRTLAVGSINGKFVFQANPNGIVAAKLDFLQHVVLWKSPEIISSARFFNQYFVCAHSGSRISLLHITVDAPETPSFKLLAETKLDSEISVVSLFETRQKLFCLVGTYSASVIFLEFTDTGELILIQEIEMTSETSVPNTIEVLSKDSGLVAVVGTRDGDLVLLDVDETNHSDQIPSAVQFKVNAIRNIGSLPLKMTPSKHSLLILSEKSFLFYWSGSGFRLIPISMEENMIVGAAFLQDNLFIALSPSHLKIIEFEYSEYHSSCLGVNGNPEYLCKTIDSEHICMAISNGSKYRIVVADVKRRQMLKFGLKREKVTAIMGFKSLKDDQIYLFLGTKDIEGKYMLLSVGTRQGSASYGLEVSNEISKISLIYGGRLAVASDNMLSIFAFTTSFIKLLGTTELRWKIRTISCSKNFIMVGCDKEGLCLFRISDEPGVLEFVKCDRFSLDTCASHFLNDSFCLAASGRDIYCTKLSYRNVTHHCLSEQFRFSVDSNVTQIRSGIMTNYSKYRGNRGCDVIVSTESGSVWLLTRLERADFGQMKRSLHHDFQSLGSASSFNDVDSNGILTANLSEYLSESVDESLRKIAIDLL